MSNEHLDLMTFENLSDVLGATLGTSPLDTGAKLNRGFLRDNRIHDNKVLHFYSNFQLNYSLCQVEPKTQKSFCISS